MKAQIALTCVLLIISTARAEYVNSLVLRDYEGTDQQSIRTICPEGYIPVGPDLNQGSGGRFIHLCVEYKRDSNFTGNGVVALHAEAVGAAKDSPDNSSFEAIPSSQSPPPLDLNKDADGDFVYLWQRKSSNKSENFISDIQIYTRGSECPNGYEGAGVDLNKGTDGQNIYLCYKTQKLHTCPICPCTSDDICIDEKEFQETVCELCSSTPVGVKNSTSVGVENSTSVGVKNSTSAGVKNTTESLVVNRMT